MTDDLHNLTPPKPDLGIGMKWHVFISYRPSDRLWATELYDVLRQRDYQVFLDQMVLATGVDLMSQLRNGLVASATGVVVWSGTSADSQWLQLEYSEMQQLSDSRGFRYVVANLDASRPPLFATQAVWIDFSSATEGPRGSGLLSLLWSLAGQPLPAEALRMGHEVDARTTQDLNRLKGYATSGNADEIVAMAQVDHPAWTSTALLGCAAADALLRMGRYAEAISILESLRERFPRSIRPAQLLSLVLMRVGRTEEAHLLLGNLYDVGVRDAQTLGMYAKSWMDRYRRDGRRDALVKARDLYAGAFNRVPSDYSLGINAASTSVILGDLKIAQHIAERVKIVLGELPSDDFWLHATRAEIELILQRYESAARAYRMASSFHPEQRASLSSVWAQAMRLLESLGASADQRAMIATALDQTS